MIRKRKQAKEIDENKIEHDILIRCPKCNSANVEFKAWVNPNTRILSKNPKFDLNGGSSLFCHNCVKCMELGDDKDHKSMLTLLLRLTPEELKELNKKFNN